MSNINLIEGLNKDQIEKTYNEIKKLEVRNTDVFLLGYPKSGTTWAQELIWLLVNDLNYEGAKAFVDERIPVLELSAYFQKNNPNEVPMECHSNSVELVKSMNDPRCIKTHLKWELLPEEIVDGTKKPKIIYISRNPKDVCVSAFYYCTNLLKIAENCSLEEFALHYLESETEQFGKYWDHVLNLWNRRHQLNVLFIRYEDMKNNMSSVIQNVSNFLGKRIIPDEEVNLIKWLDFETMKNNPAVNHVPLYNKPGFMRTGKIGDHKSIMSEELVKKFDSWIEKSLKGSDYSL